MTTADSPHRDDRRTAAATEALVSATRHRLGMGRLLPLGGPSDGAWISERAAAGVLRRTAARPGVVIGKLRLGLADPDAVAEPVVPRPPSALPPGPLRIEASLAATDAEPLPAAAAALRSALLSAAAARLGLVVSEVDLRVTELLDAAPGQPTGETAAEGASADAVRGDEPDGPAGIAAAAVPGVVSLTRMLGSGVHVAADHVRVEVAASGDRRTLDVALAVREAVTAAVAGHPPVAVLVTAVVDDA
ncbi:hypothetical protein [Streptomyces sp. DT171]|uniref:hypothetical protein n=1 Tax=Streptomyces sp. DT171 TaxID=3416524 RepID=UPI003CE6EA4A